MSSLFEVPPLLESESGMGFDFLYVDEEQSFEQQYIEALGVNPLMPTPATPGSVDKVAMLAARYAAGLPLWHESDCSDHGPGEQDLMGRQLDD